MPVWAVLVVVVVRDPGLRSALAARLALDGANLLTAGNYRDARIERMMRRPGILVIDEASIDGGVGGWLETQWMAGRWHRIIMVTVDAPVPADQPDWLTYVSRGSAADSIGDLIEHWKSIENPDRVPKSPD